MVDMDQKNVLLALIHDPRYNLNNIRDYLKSQNVSMSYYSVKKAYEKLIEDGILRQMVDGETNIYDPCLPVGIREISAVEGSYIPEKLGLQRHHVVFKGIPNQKSLDILNIICDMHPYTILRSDAFGQGMKVYVKFDIPIGTEDIMREFYTEVTSIVGARDFILIASNRTTISDLKLYKLSENGWDFFISRKNIENGMDCVSDCLEDLWENTDGKFQESHHEENSIIKLRELEYVLIRELTINYNVKADSLKEYYHKDRTTISRYLNNLKEHIMDKPRLYYDRLTFDLSSPQMLIGHSEDLGVINKLHTVFGSERFPYRVELISDNENFILIFMIPPAQVMEFSQFIWQFVPELENMIISISAKSAKRYYFDHRNYNYEKKEWISSRKYLLDNVLENF